MHVLKRKRPLLNVASAAVALLLMSLLVWQASSAAFTAQTSEDITVDAGQITLSDDDASATFTPVLYPGQSDAVCVTVTYNQTPTSPAAPLATVHVYGSFSDGSPALSGDVEIQVDEGCSAGSTILGSGTITSVIGTGNAEDYVSGSGTWVPSGDGDSQDYLITFTMPSSTTDAAQGGSVDVTVTWEVQTS